MNENMTINIEKDQDNGQITYANEVISTIVSVATAEVEGISAIVGASSTMAGIIGKGKTPRGVRVDMDDQDVSVDVSVTVDYGMPIQKVGRDAQENVRKSIESMTGLRVDKVDLHVVGVSFEKENQEMQMSQQVATIEDGEEDEDTKNTDADEAGTEVLKEESVTDKESVETEVTQDTDEE